MSDRERAPRGVTQVARPFDPADLRFEYGLDGIRLLPWPGLSAPFGGAYCIVRPRSCSEEHVNAPSDEDELFLCFAGHAEVLIDDRALPAKPGDTFFIPRGVKHYVRNTGDEPFHFYAIWWNPGLATGYLQDQARQPRAYSI